MPPQGDFRHHARLTSKERQHLLDTVQDNPRNDAMLRLIADTSLSAVQIATLTPGDVSPVGRFVVYHEHGSSWRVSFSDTTALALHHWCKFRPADSSSLFGLSANGVLQVVGRAYKAAGVRRLGIRGLYAGPVEKVDSRGKIIHMRV